MVAAACALSALGWGLYSLQRVFADETADARARLEGRSETRLRAVREALSHELEAALEASYPRAQDALVDPLVSDQGVYLFWHDHQYLPRLERPLPSSATPGRATYEQLAQALATGQVLTEWAEVQRHLRGIEDTLQTWPGDSPPKVVSALYAALGSRKPSEAVPALVVVIERLHASGLSTSELAAMVGGGAVGDFRGVAFEPGLERRLLERCDVFGQTDFDALARRVDALIVEAGLSPDAFRARVDTLHTGVSLFPRGIVEPTLLDGAWYVEPAGRAERGVALDLRALLGRVVERLRGSHVLGARDELHLGSTTGIRPVGSLELQLSSPELEVAAREIGRRFQLKNALIATCSVFALTLVALGIVTQRRRAQYLALKSEFVASVSHELRTPLASIRLLAETLERRPDDQAVQDYPRRIVRAADDLHFLVENILSFNRLSRKGWSVERSQVRVDELGHSLEGQLSTLTRQPVSLVVEGGGLELDADVALVRLLLSNLARNGCAYNRRSPVQLTMRASRTSTGETVLHFADNGFGIPADEWERVFDDFYRSSAAGTTHGFGLGLALCRRIMEVHRGRITVYHSSPEGTTFELRFPRGES